MQLKLIVIRSGDMPKLVEFYSLLGLTFEYHKHGNSPYHYSVKFEEVVMEIYPLSKDQSFADKSLRLGFMLNNFDEVILLMKNHIISTSMQTEWGIMAVIQDPDGRKIEIYKSEQNSR